MLGVFLRRFFKTSFDALFVLWVVASLTFLLLRFLPGGPFDDEQALLPEVRERLESSYGLDRPLGAQYLLYFQNLLRGDLGESLRFLGQSVGQIIGESFPPSLILGLCALAWAYLWGLGAGLLAARFQGTGIDRALMILVTSGVALPSFLTGPILVIFFSFFLGWLPAALALSPLHYVLPVITLGLRPAAVVARLVRSSALESYRADYVTAARARGAGEWRILWTHVLKNSFVPVLSISGVIGAGVLSGSFIIELIFALPGLGHHMVQSVINRDYPLVMGVTLVYTALLVFFNWMIDTLLTCVDPRIELKASWR